MYKSFKYRIYPNEEQRILLEKHFGCTRFVYNYFLDYKQTQYKTTGTSGTYNQVAKELVNLKEDSNYSWLKEVNSQSLQQSLKDMFNSYERFFRGLSKFPKFKKKGEKNSFTLYVSNDLKVKRYNMSKCNLLKDRPKTSYDIGYHQDLVIDGLGFIKIVSKAKVDVYVDINVNVFERDSVI